MKLLRSRFRLIALLLVCAFLVVLGICTGSALKAAGIDKLVEAALQHNKDRYQSAMSEMIRLKREISALKQELQDHEKQLPYYSLVTDVLEDELESRHVMPKIQTLSGKLQT